MPDEQLHILKCAWVSVKPFTNTKFVFAVFARGFDDCFEYPTPPNYSGHPHPFPLPIGPPAPNNR